MSKDVIGFIMRFVGYMIVFSQVTGDLMGLLICFIGLVIVAVAPLVSEHFGEDE